MTYWALLDSSPDDAAETVMLHIVYEGTNPGLARRRLEEMRRSGWDRGGVFRGTREQAYRDAALAFDKQRVKVKS